MELVLYPILFKKQKLFLLFIRSMVNLVNENIFLIIQTFVIVMNFVSLCVGLETKYTPAQWPCGRVSALSTGGSGFAPRPSHTKDFKNGTQ